jgi:general secretion pathway protein E
MIDMGVEPFLLRSSVIGVLAQRLVRVLCPHCKEPYEASVTDLEELGLSEDRCAWRRRRQTIPTSRYYPRNVSPADPLEEYRGQYQTFYRAKGCDKCAQTGFMGRRGIYELLMMDDTVGPLVLKGADAQTIKRSAMDQGMDSLRDDGARKVIAGLTSVEEVLVATQDDMEVEPDRPSVRNVRV